MVEIPTPFGVVEVVQDVPTALRTSDGSILWNELASDIRMLAHQAAVGWLYGDFSNPR
jgi:hypothetical protein